MSPVALDVIQVSTAKTSESLALLNDVNGQRSSGQEPRDQSAALLKVTGRVYRSALYRDITVLTIDKDIS